MKRVHPPRASLCIPLLIDPENAYDITVRPTPEMQAAGKPPGMNLGDKLLNEPGQPERCCVVLQVAGEDGVANARARLLDALRAREAAAQSPGLKTAKERLGHALWKRGYFPPRCRASLRIAISQPSGRLPASHGPAERCGTAPHPRC